MRDRTILVGDACSAYHGFGLFHTKPIDIYSNTDGTLSEALMTAK